MNAMSGVRRVFACVHECESDAGFSKSGSEWEITSTCTSTLSALPAKKPIKVGLATYHLLPQRSAFLRSISSRTEKKFDETFSSDVKSVKY